MKYKNRLIVIDLLTHAGFWSMCRLCIRPEISFYLFKDELNRDIWVNVC